MAHETHGQPQHGGIVAEAGVFQGELVARGGKLIIYLSEHGQPLPAKGAKGRLTLLAGGQRQELTLTPAGDNTLQATAAWPPGAKAAAVITLADGLSGVLRFEARK
jgi:nitrogen fixation protein FixH